MDNDSLARYFTVMLDRTVEFFKKATLILGNAQNWFNENKDVIATYVNGFLAFGILDYAIDLMLEKQIVFTDDLNLDFAEKIRTTSDIDKLVENYYFDNNEQQINNLIKKCKNAKEMLQYKQLFYETIEAYKLGHYYLACGGMFMLLDGIIAEYQENKKDTNFGKRFKEIENKFLNKIELSNIDMKIFTIFKAIYPIMNKEDNFSVFKKSCFNEKEPDLLNRNWVLHGRSQRTYTRYDFLKVLLWLDAIIILFNLDNEYENLKALSTTD